MELLPATARPYIGGSGTNSVIALLLGYDGLGRLFGGGGPGGSGGGPGAGFSGVPGILRLFNPEFGGQIAWLLPLAFAGLGIGLVARRRTPRTDAARAAYLLWGGWLLVHVLVFSFMSGIIHTYYVVAMAPAIGALVGGGIVELWRARERLAAGGLLLGAAIAGSAVVAWLLLQRTVDFAPGLGVAILLGGVIVAAALALPRRIVPTRAALVPAVAGIAILLAAPAAYAVDTMQTAYSGGDPSAGPRSAGAGMGPGGPGSPQSRGPNGQREGQGSPFGGPGGPNGGTTDGNGAAGIPGRIPPPGGVSIDRSLIDFLESNHGSETWLVAVASSGEAAELQLSTGVPVMAMGGFSGGDDALTVEQLEAYVANGRLRYILLGDGRDGGFRDSSAIDAWVTKHGTPVTSVDGGLYDLAGAVSES
jgi:4-amino-4-deoxy-L-arabinose transferase-like glycosyltransferase